MCQGKIIFVKVTSTFIFLNENTTGIPSIVKGKLYWSEARGGGAIQFSSKAQFSNSMHTESAAAGGGGQGTAVSSNLKTWKTIDH